MSSDKYQPIHFQKNYNVTRIVGEWPQYVQISTDLFGIQAEYLSVDDDGHVVIEVSNGKGIYKLDREQGGIFVLNLVLVKGVVL